MNVIPDTPVWSLLLRRRPDALSREELALRGELAELIREGRVVLLGPIRQEVLSGISDGRMFTRLRDHLVAFGDEQLGVADYEEAARCHNACRTAGVAGSATDFLICATALRRNLAIFTTDRDFHHYAEILMITLHRPREPDAGRIAEGHAGYSRSLQQNLTALAATRSLGTKGRRTWRREEIHDR